MFNSVALRLREGVEPRPMFDSRAYPVYWMLGGTIIAAVIALVAGGYSIDRAYVEAAWSIPALLLAAFAARRVGHPSIAGALETNTLLTGEAVFVYLLLIPLAASGRPYVDPLLARSDAALGFNWVAYARAAEPYIPLLFKAYRSFQLQPTIIIVVLFWCGLDDRAWKLVIAATFALVVTALSFPFVPAKGAFAFYKITNYPEISIHGEWKVAETLDHIRNGAKVVDHNALGGIVSFPSFHTVMAVLFVWAAWPTRLRVPVFVLNVLMVLAAIVCGSHYLVDILSGAALGALSIIVAQQVTRLVRLQGSRT